MIQEEFPVDALNYVGWAHCFRYALLAHTHMSCHTRVVDTEVNLRALT